MSKFHKFVVVGDNHGNLVLPEAIRKLSSFIATWKPHSVVHIGDNFDFTALRGGASIDEQMVGMKEDIAAGKDFLGKIKPKSICWGNHDDRLIQTIKRPSSGLIGEYCEQVQNDIDTFVKKMGIETVPYKVSSYYQLPVGGPKFIHGFRSTMYPAKAHYEKWGPCIHGHVHTPAAHTPDHADGGMALSIPCMADIDKLEYADRQYSKLRWRSGFGYGVINERTGKWSAWNVQLEDGDWISPMGIL